MKKDRIHELNVFTFFKSSEREWNLVPFFKDEREVKSIPEKKERAMLWTHLIKICSTRTCLGWGPSLWSLVISDVPELGGLIIWCIR